MRRTLFTAAAVTAVVVGLPGVAAADTSYVTPADIAGACPLVPPAEWCTFERGAGSAEIGPGVPDAASGTDHLLIETPLVSNDKAYVFGYEFAGQPLSSIETLGYRSYVDPASTSADLQAPALNIEIDRNGGSLESGEYAVLVWEPYYAGESTAHGVWLQRSPSSSDGGWWSPANTPVVTGANGALGFPSFTADWSDVVAALPDATVLGIGLNQGGGNAGLLGQVDLLQIDGTVYDFESTAPEPQLTPVTKDECKKGGWATFNAPTFRNQGDCVSYVAGQGRGR